MKAMRGEYRSVFLLFHEQGLPYEDIGRALGKPVGTIKTWLHRARLEVLAHLRKRGYDVRVSCLAEPASLEGDAVEMAKRWRGVRRRTTMSR